MTLLYTQGFEGFPSTGEDRTDFDKEFNFHDSVGTGNAGITTGRIVGQAAWVDDGANVNCGFRLPVGGYSQEDTWIVGFGFYLDYGDLAGPTDPSLLRFRAPNEGAMFTLVLKSGTLAAHTGGPGGTFVANIIANVLARTWYFLEVKITFHATAGSVIVRLNEEEVMNETNIDTISGSPTLYPSEINFGQAGLNVGCFVDDIYICDDAGSSQNDFLGDVRLEILNPTATGTTAQFTAVPGAGDNYEDVNEADVDDDTSYVESNTVGHQDTYTFGNLSTTPIKIEAVSVKTYCRKADGGSRTYKHVAIGDVSGTPASAFSDTVYASAGSWRHLQSHFVVDPDTSAAWTEAGVNDAEFGFKIDT